MDWNYGSVSARFCVQKSVQEAVGGPGDNRAAASSIWIKLVFLTPYSLASPGTTSHEERRVLLHSLAFGHHGFALVSFRQATTFRLPFFLEYVCPKAGWEARGF